MNNLFHVSQRLKNIENIIEDEGGEVNLFTEIALKYNEIEFKQVLNEVFALLQVKTMEIEAIKNRIEFFQKILSKKEKTKRFCENSLSDAVGVIGSFNVEEFQISRRKYEVLCIFDEESIPLEYFKAGKPDKVLIKAELRRGKIIKGTELQTRYSLTIK